MRFWIDRACLRGTEFLIKGQLYHHICQVCRIQKGEVFELFCEGLQKYQVSLQRVSASQAVAKILKVFPVPPLKTPYLHLALSVPRPSKLDFIVEKAVELGVKGFCPFVSELSWIKKAKNFSASKSARLEKIACQSLALSGRTEPLKIHPLSPLKEISPPTRAIALMAYEGSSSDKQLPLFADLADHQLAGLSPPPSELWLFIGSEGGFSAEEARHFSLKQRHFLFSLGERILRVETACLFGLSILKQHFRL